MASKDYLTSSPGNEAKEYYPNGVSKARKIPRSDAGFRRSSGYVAAIDFGSTYCSVAYTLQGEEEIRKLPLDGPHTRVPNTILIEKKSSTVVAFGQGAQHRFAQLKQQQENYLLFEKIKMILYRSQDVNRNMPVSPINSSEQYYLVEVIAFILKYLKDNLYKALELSGLDLSQVQFDWVVTVPAIWDICGKQMMREAAYKAGLCSSPPICKLTPYSSSRKLNRPAEANPDRLSLALEPEAAGLFCQNSRDSEHRYKPQDFTVLDIGGGTVDITSYHIDQDGNFHVVDKASGNDWGGTRVNETFEQFLESVVEDHSFKQYLSVSDPQIQQKHKADLNKLIYTEFEQEKAAFGDEKDDDERVPAVINIPSSFLKIYKEKLHAAIKSHYSDVAELDEHELSIEPQKMKQFFQPAIENICQNASEALEKVRKKDPANETKAVYLVGGFGGCKFIEKVVQEYLLKKCSPELKVLVPIDNKLAVACGAIMFRQKPEIIWARKAEATYGDIVSAQFNAEIHDPAYMTVNEDGVERCSCLFRPFIEVGDTIYADKVLQNAIIPRGSEATEMRYIVYSSDKRGIWYARDKDTKQVSGVKKIGMLVFDLEGIPGETRHDKKVILTIDFSQTEIQLKAHHEKSGKEVKVVLDTLDSTNV